MSNQYFLSPQKKPAVQLKSNAMISFFKSFLQRSSWLNLLALSLIAGILTGLLAVYQIGFTSYAAEVESLAEYQPGEITKVYAEDGKTIIGELALERRVPLAYEEIPEKMKQAVLAIEDLRFRDHMGIDIIRVGGATLKNILTFSKREGASTLTQQVARQLFLKSEKTWTRKIREMIYALQIERYYTKDQIMTLYCNQINLGGGAYGIEAASNYYFGKKLKDCKLEEFAMLAAIPKSPTNYNPARNPETALKRRNLVLNAMADAGFIEESEAEAAKSRPIKLNLSEAKKSDRGPFAYIIEDVRKELAQLAEERGAQDAMNIYSAGLSIYTTIDPDAQKYMQKVIHDRLKGYDHRKGGWRGNLINVIEKENADLETYHNETWAATAPEKGEIVTGLITEVNAQGAKVSFGNYSATVGAKETQWTRKTPAGIFKRGDLANFNVLEVDTEKKTVSVELEQNPEIQAGMVLIDSKNGEIKAEVGGYDFALSKFNHATQALRQTGSVFKPFIYSTAIEEGLKPDDVVSDTPFSRAGWAPHNYDNSYKGSMPIKTALAQSRNIPAVRILDEVGVNQAAKMVQRFGLPNPMAPSLASALGATEEPLLAMVSAYSTFPNKGIRIEPHRIRKIVDREGRVIEEAKPKEFRVIHEYVAGTMVQLMRGVVTSGTAKAANGLQGHLIAGKTGTVNDFTDAWFIGYTPRYTCGNWIGYSENKKSLGHGESGGSAALPFWIDFMRHYLANKERDNFYKIPEAPKEIKDAIRARDKDRSEDSVEAAKKRANRYNPGDRIPILRTADGGISSDAPNSLKDLDDKPTVIEKSAPAPEKVAPTPPPTPRPEPRPRITTPEPKTVEQEGGGKKGKKGKASDDPPQ